MYEDSVKNSELLRFIHVFVGFGHILLALTSNIVVYQSADEIQTLGLKTWSGLPVLYKVSAPSMLWMEFSWPRMIISMLIWEVTVFTALNIFVKYHITKHPEAELG